MSVHLRQFLIGPESRLVRPDWQSVELRPGLHLSHCPTLPLVKTASGLVLGDRIAMDASGDTRSWAGRWILLTGSRLQLDTCGLLGCSYRTTESGWWASSSPEILRELQPELPMHEDRLERDRRLMDWYPPPHSAIEGIGRLLPSEVMSLEDGSRHPVALPAGEMAGEAEVDREAVLRRTQERLLTAIRHAAELAAAGGGRLWIGLTSGRDSRTLLAAALSAGLEPMTYTFIREKTSSGDRELPPLLAAAAGLEHVTIPLEGIDAERAARFDRHTAASYAGGARLQYATGAWEQVEASAVVLEGGCFEFARGTYYYRLPREMGVSAEGATATILERFPSQRPAGVRAWVDWVRGEGQQAGLDWRDRFFLEQRCGGSLSAGLQGFDLTGRRMVLLANCHGLLSDLIGLPEDERRSGAHQDELVRRFAPTLATHPYNPGSTKGHKARKATGSRAAPAGASNRVATRLRRLRRRTSA